MASTRGRDPAVEEEFLGALYKGGELLAAGKIVEAREHLEKAHGLAPKNEKAQNLLGLTYFKLGLYDRASEVYEKLVNENPADATLRVNLGLVYLKTNNLERCIKEFETATDLEPTHKKAHNYLGLALAQQGTYVKAKEHFELAGSDQMAEKMSRAIANQASPSGLQTAVPRQGPKTVVLGEEDSTPPQLPPPLPVKAKPQAQIVDDEAIEVMSDEEPPSDAFIIPDDVRPPPPPPADIETIDATEDALNDTLNSDWGAALPSAPTPPPTVAPPPRPASDDMRFAEDEGPSEAELAPVEEMPMLDASVVEDAVVEVVADVPPPPPLEEAAPIEATAIDSPPPSPGPSVPTPSWLTMEASEAPPPEPPPASQTEWVTDGLGTPVPQPPPAEVVSTDSGWVTEGVADVPLEPEAVTASVNEAAPPSATDARWANTNAEMSGTWTESIDPVPEQPADESWAAEAAPQPSDDSWATSTAPEGIAADDPSWAMASAAAQEVASEPVHQTIAPMELPPEVPSTSPSGLHTPDGEPLPTIPDDDSWATGAAAAETESEPVFADAPMPALDPVPTVEVASELAPEEPMPAPSPSAPLPITVEEPASAPAPLPPAGYSPMTPQRLVDLGASSGWVHEPNAGPFHLSSDGLAVTVSGEMLMRMAGLIAVVGSINVEPENRRRRGRPSSEAFGTGPTQLQRVSGNGVVYLEPGRSKFHAVDLTDQNGVSIDDDGAYLREELVFAFEEPISFENGKLSNEAQSLELAHLKGNGRVLLQLDGTLRAMPIPLGAPLVVPVQRMVGWFGRVTPRLMGFGGRGAVELTGEGYALLGTPAERA